MQQRGLVLDAIVDNALILGSTNWTTSSSKNTELSALVELSAEGKKAYEAWKDLALANAVSFLNFDPPGHSDSQLDRYRTAKRYSIARSRSMGVLQRLNTPVP